MTIERKILTQLLADEREYFFKDPQAAARLLAIGELNQDSEPGESEMIDETETIEVAAMTTLCQAILNLDATIWKR